MANYATGMMRRVHYRKPSGETGWRAAAYDDGEDAAISWVESQGWEYTHTTYQTTSGTQAPAPAPAPTESEVTPEESPPQQPGDPEFVGPVQDPAGPPSEPPSPQTEFETRVTAAKLRLPVGVVKAIDERQQDEESPSPPDFFGPSSDYKPELGDVQKYPGGPIEKGEGVVLETFPKGEGIQSAFYGPANRFGQLSNEYGEAAQYWGEYKFDPDQTYYIQAISDEELTRRREIDPNYQPPYRVLTGTEAKAWAREKAEEYGEKSKDLSIVQGMLFHKGKIATREWHPETKVVQYDPTQFRIDPKTGKLIVGPTEDATPGASYYHMRFPYAGAELYGKYTQVLKEGDIALGLATAFTPEDPLGLRSAFAGDKQAAIDVKVKALHRVATVEEQGGLASLAFAQYWFESPLAQIGMAATIAAGIGAASTAAGGFIGVKYGATAALAYKTALAGAGGFFVGMAAGDVARTAIKEEDLGEAAVKGIMYGFQFAAAIAGYRAGSRMLIRGATPGEWGARRGFESRIKADVKSGKIDPEFGAEHIRRSQLEFKLKRAYRNITPEQMDPAFKNIQTLQDELELRAFFERHPFVRKAGIFGSAAEGRAEIHDLDIMYQRALGIAEARYAGTKTTGGDVSKYADIKPWQRVGSQVGRMGTIKQPWYKTPGDYSVMRLSESALRHGESALELAHIGRVKDIPRAVELYELLHQTAGSPAKMQPVLDEYKVLMAALQKEPLLMSSAESELVYGSSLTEKWWQFKTSAYEKILSKSWFEKSYQTTMDITKPTAVISGGPPPSPAVSFIPSPIISAAIFSISIPSQSESAVLVEIIPPSSSIKKPESPSVSISKSISPSESISRSLSKKSTSPYPSESMSQSIIDKYISESISRSSISSSSPSTSPSISSSSSSSTSSSASSIVHEHASYFPRPSPGEKQKQGQAYNVYIKERYIFEGKKQRPEKFVKMDEGPLSEADAKSLLMTALDESAARSGYIKPTEGEPKDPTIPTKNHIWLEHKFRKKGNKYVEKTDYAIDTPGEIDEITAKGWAAERKRIQKSIDSVMKPRGLRRSIAGDDQVDYDDVRKNMDNFYKKLRKGVGM